MNAEVMQAIRSNPEKMQQVQQRFAEVLTRSAGDADFRRQLVTDPRAALSAHFGKEIPESVNIRFVESGGTPTIVLPDPVNASAELSDAELESVAGGVIPALITIGACLYVIGDLIIN
jgi:hypothetical protein